jgi:hypothetical protein
MRASVIAMLVLFGAVASEAEAALVRTLESPVGLNEYDTAERPDGQAGGALLGRNYTLETLRCGAGEAIVGARVRRGVVLDHLEIACAVPTCDAAGCRWSELRPGGAAGNDAGGNPSPPMMCERSQVVTGFSASVVTFTMFDYVADIELECSEIAAVQSAEGVVRVARYGGRRVHPEGGLGAPSSSSSRGLAREQLVTTPTISCRPDGAATAFSLAVADFVQAGQRVVQAISLYCPKANPLSLEALIQAMDQCLQVQSGVRYYTSPSLAVRGATASYDGDAAAILYNPALLNQQQPWWRVFWLAGAFGAHVVNLEQQRFGVSRSPAAYLGEGDFIAGWLARCLYDQNLLPAAGYNSPEHPLLQYEDFLWSSGFALPGDPSGVQRRSVDWENGFKTIPDLPPAITHN